MLSCVYHPTDEMRVVNSDEHEKLLSTGVWFDTPTEAKEMRKKYEDQVIEENAREENSRKKRKKPEEKS